MFNWLELCTSRRCFDKMFFHLILCVYVCVLFWKEETDSEIHHNLETNISNVKLCKKERFFLSLFWKYF